MRNETIALVFVLIENIDACIADISAQHRKDKFANEKRIPAEYFSHSPLPTQEHP